MSRQRTAKARGNKAPSVLNRERDRVHGEHNKRACAHVTRISARPSAQQESARDQARDKDLRAIERAWASATGDYRDRDALSRQATHVTLSRQRILCRDRVDQ